jgi:alkylhydroperoxidase family enzyme
MFLLDVEQREPKGTYARPINELRAAGVPVPQIMHLFAYKPDRTEFLSRFTQGVMRGPSPLSPGLRELIAAFTSKRNECPFWVVG